MDFEDKKEPYQKPKLTTIELKAEEVLGVGCKTLVLNSGPAFPNCINTNCAAEGS